MNFRLNELNIKEDKQEIKNIEKSIKQMNKAQAELRKIPFLALKLDFQGRMRNKMISNEQIAHDLVMVYLNNKYGVDVIGDFDVWFRFRAKCSWFWRS